MIELQEIFEVDYGVNLELNKLTEDPKGINFVSRTSKNNGVSAKVQLIDIEPIPAGTLSVAGGGSVLETFLQPEPYYSGRDLYYLTPKVNLSDSQKLFYCACIRLNKYKYSYGRQANRTLKSLLVPSIDEIPDWIHKYSLDPFDSAKKTLAEKTDIELDIQNWKPFRYSDLFDIERGRGPRIKDLNGRGNIPFITSIESSNGLTSFTSMEAMHSKNTIGVNRNGSVAEAFYHEYDYCSTEDVHIFSPKFPLNKYIAMFIITLIKKEKYRYNYGRKWGLSRMKESIIRLPVDINGQPDWQFMENYIKQLSFSSSI